MGAYLSQYGPFIPWLGALMATGAYAIGAMDVGCAASSPTRCRSMPIAAPGGPEAAYLIERLMDAIAFETGLTVDTVRARNFVRPEQMPFKAPTGRTYDSGEFEGHMRQGHGGRRLGDHQGPRQGRQEAGQAARHRHGDLYRGLRRRREGARDRQRWRRTAPRPC